MIDNTLKRMEEEKKSTQNSIPSENTLQKQDKDIFKYMKADRINHKQVSTKRNYKGVSSHWREIHIFRKERRISEMLIKLLKLKV